MKRLIVYIIIFFLPIILIGLFSESLLRRIPNDYLYKKRYLDSNSQNIEVLVLGNSHAFYGIDPQYFKLRGFNASNVSQSLEYDYAILKKYTKWDNLKYIILTIDDFSLFSDIKEGAESWRVKNYEIYYNIHISNDITYNTEILSNNFRVNGKRLYNYYIKDTTSITCSELGWGNNYNSRHNQNLIVSGKIAAKRHHVLTNENFVFNVKTLTDIIKIAEAKKVKVIMYTSPVYKTYVKYSDKNQLSVTIDVIKNLVEAHSNINYYNWLTNQSFVATDFYDADHLNEKGAKKFSIKMDSVISTFKL